MIKRNGKATLMILRKNPLLVSINPNGEKVEKIDELITKLATEFNIALNPKKLSEKIKSNSFYFEVNENGRIVIPQKELKKTKKTTMNPRDFER